MNILFLLLLSIAVIYGDGDYTESSGTRPIEINCQLDPDVGLCKALIPRFFYNSTTKRCEEFFYGGCGGNSNNFQTLDDCQTNCVDDDDGTVEPTQSSGQLDCTSNPDNGMCYASLPRYFHNITSKQCEQFVYGGCGGNANNFVTVEECQKKCGYVTGVSTTAETVPDEVVNCKLEPEVGMCRALLPRFFHNTTTEQCEQFFYGGCGGNTNNFLSLEDCQQKCDVTPKAKPEPTEEVNCVAEPEVGNCLALLPRYFHNTTTKQCEEFYYGGCGGNTNNFLALEECQLKCNVPNCTVEPDAGYCKALLPRYFHNTTNMQCEEFFYGGCGGNTNNFMSLEDCQQKCSVTAPKAIAEPEPSQEVNCVAEPEVGNCLALLPRYFHNATTKQCEEFYYGGCGGNTNNFLTLEECQLKCNVPNCVVEPDVGYCKALLPRYFHNATSMQCEEFFYGGCGGNTNNFLSLGDCQQKCGVTAPKAIAEPEPSQEVNCVVEPEVGNCFALLARYFHNATTKQCEEFYYGGCGGNTNNFLTLEECQSKCNVVNCAVKPDVGFCKALLPRYFYNTTNMQCEEFFYGGCGGNSNNFLSLDECQSNCKVKPVEKSSDEVNCSARYEVGNCKALLPRYYYNSTIKLCAKFYYGGCGGNSNRFLTEDDCLAKCGSKPLSKLQQTLTSVREASSADLSETHSGKKVSQSASDSGAFSVTENISLSVFLVMLATSLL